MSINTNEHTQSTKKEAIGKLPKIPQRQLEKFTEIQEQQFLLLKDYQVMTSHLTRITYLKIGLK